jgi:UDP-glucose 4-epimerase
LDTHIGTRKKVLLTGGNGTLGCNILKLLAANDQYQVVAPVRNILSPAIQPLADRIHFIQLDLSDPVATAQMFERVSPAIIIHCAASGLRPAKETSFDVVRFNVTSTMDLFQMNCRLDHPSHFIYISTGLVYRSQGRPLTEEDPLGTLHPYGASKASADLMLQAVAADFNRRLTILRPFAFTGENDCANRLFPLILQAAVDGKRQPLTAGTQIRDFCSVNDIALAVTQVMEREQSSLVEKFNLGSGLSMPLRQLIEGVCDGLELKSDLAFGESAMNPFESKHSVANITRAKAELGWKPRTGITYAVWELAQQIAPTLRLKRPERDYGLA